MKVSAVLPETAQLQTGHSSTGDWQAPQQHESGLPELQTQAWVATQLLLFIRAFLSPASMRQYLFYFHTKAKPYQKATFPKSAREITSLPFFLFTNKPLEKVTCTYWLYSLIFPFTFQHTKMWCLALPVFAVHQGPSNDCFHSSSFLCMPPWNPCPWLLECPGSPLTLSETAFESHWIGSFPPFPKRCYSTAVDPFRF